ncbi:hypothetical protein ACIQC5_01085 [Paenarthrobacter sp. NPDC092416]|uniref:hypothetical protein n=1 Tax=Paenarthrobacter sp. NPDC092416 TaxID=3364386 RepID=UPI0037F84B2C
MSDLAPSNYQRWEAPVVNWSDINEFLATTDLADGLHVVADASGSPIEILVHAVQAESNNTALPVFFTGAVDKRSEKTGPFFSGRSLAQRAGCGFVAISDPTLNLDSSLGLAWYAGSRDQDVQGKITTLLAKIADLYSRELLLIGGSGGGFAALYFGYQLGDKCSVLAWNPQTDIFKYSPSASKAYFESAFGSQIVSALQAPRWEDPTKEFLDEFQITYDLMGLAEDGTPPRRVLIFQNASDWHVGHHLAPFISTAGFRHMGRGVHEKDKLRLAVLRDFGVDHAPLPSTAVLAAMGSLKTLENDAHSALRLVDAALPVSARPFSTLPRDLSALAPRITEELTLEVSQTAGVWTARVELGQMPEGYGGATYSFFHSTGASTHLYPAQSEPNFEFEAAGESWDHVGVVVKDGFLNEILVLRGPVAAASATA